MSTLAFIGSAGRGTDRNRINEDYYGWMLDEARSLVSAWNVTRGVSGGAAFADHTVVSLFLEGTLQKLKLYLPADFINGVYSTSGSKNQDGRTANEYHLNFRQRCGVDGLREIKEAVFKGAEIEVYHGFKRRNIEVAHDCDYLAAATFGHHPSAFFAPDTYGFKNAQAAGLKDGGTADTWNKCYKAEMKKHINLNDLV